MDLKLYILTWVCIIGLCLGSFFNVVILRSLSGESIIFPPSKCPKCGNRLKLWHNIPVISYIFLRGKCAFCNERISLQYPIVEITTMLVFALAFVKFGISFTALFAFLWLSCLIIMTVTDIKAQIVDCNIAVIMMLSGVLFCGLNSGWSGVWSSLSGALIGAVIIEVIARIGYLAAKERAMGEADTYVAAAIGAIVGYGDVLSVLIYGFIAAMFFIVPLFLYNRYKANDKEVLITSILFVLASLCYCKIVQNYLTLGFLIVVGCFLVHFILKNINNEQTRTYLPFVPALCLGFLYYLFFVL